MKHGNIGNIVDVNADNTTNSFKVKGKITEMNQL